MTQNERIETIREVFPGYTKPLDSMCKSRSITASGVPPKRKH